MAGPVPRPRRGGAPAPLLEPLTPPVMRRPAPPPRDKGMRRPVVITPSRPREPPVPPQRLVARRPVEAADTPMVGPVTAPTIAPLPGREGAPGRPCVVTPETTGRTAAVERSGVEAAAARARAWSETAGATPPAPKLVLVRPVTPTAPDPPSSGGSAWLVAPRLARPGHSRPRRSPPRIEGVPRPEALTNTPVMIPPRPVAAPRGLRRGTARSRLLTRPITRPPRERVVPEVVGRAAAPGRTVVAVSVATRLGAHLLLDASALAIPTCSPRALGAPTP